MSFICLYESIKYSLSVSSLPRNQSSLPTIAEKEQIYCLSAKAYKKEKPSFGKVGSLGEINENDENKEFEEMFFWGYMIDLVKQEVKLGRRTSEIING